MKFSTIFSVLLGSVSVVQAQMAVDAQMTCHKAVWTDKAWKEAKSNMAKQGNCLYYRGDMDLSTCGKGCEGGEEAVGCMAKYPEGIEDPKGNCFWGGTCMCPKDVEWVGDLIVMIVDALNEFFQKIVDAIVCSGILDAILMTVDIGLSLIPGGAIASTAMRTGIRIAKSVAEAGSDRSAFEEWFGAQCGSKPTDIEKVWKEWTGVPDDVLPSFPGGECVKSGKKKKGCKKAPNDADDKKKEEEAKKKWEEDHKKTSTKKTTAKSTAAPETKSTVKSTTISASKTSSKSSATSKSSVSASSKYPTASASPSATSKASASSATSKPSSVISKSTASSKSSATTKSVAPSSSSRPASSVKPSSQKSTVKPSSSSASVSSSKTTSAEEEEETEGAEKPGVGGIIGAIGAITSLLNITVTATPTSSSSAVFVTSGPGY